MTASRLILFGKHPAWSDHMYVFDDASISHYLKRIFYDHSVIPALQGGQGDQLLPEACSFLVFIDRQVFFIATKRSRDSVGRKRFPLIATYLLPENLKIENSPDKLNLLRDELRDLLDDLLEPSSAGPDQWQKDVERKAQSFVSKVDWSSTDSSETQAGLERDTVAGIMHRLSSGNDGFDLKSCPLSEACNLVQAGLKQFKSMHPALLILDEKTRGDALFFALEKSGSFRLKRYLYKNLTPLSVPASSVSAKVNNLLKPLASDGGKLLSVKDIPSLKLGDSSGPVSLKFILIGVAVILLITLSAMLFFSGSEECDESPSSCGKREVQQSSARSNWISNTTAYLEWIQPLVFFTEGQPSSEPGFDSIRENLELELNPFSVIEAQAVGSIRLAKNPPDEVFNPDARASLDVIYSNIDQLKATLTTYYKEQFTDEFIKELKRQNYPVPVFVEIDFSQQPILPDFGSGLTLQLETCRNTRSLLSKLSATNEKIGASIIRPLHKMYPEHAKHLQRYIQSVIERSGNVEQFNSNYEKLLKTLRYPNGVKLDTVNPKTLAEDSAWLDLIRNHDWSLESVQEMVDLLDSHQLGKRTGQTGYSDKGIKNNQAQTGTNGLEQWDASLKTELKKFQDDRLAVEIQAHADSIRELNFTDVALTGDEALAQLQQQTDDLLAAFQNLDTAFLRENSEMYAQYLADRQSAGQFADYVFSEYQASSVEPGNMESINEVSRRIGSGVEQYLAELNEAIEDFGNDYLALRLNQLSAYIISGRITEIAENPLYAEDVHGARLKFLKAAALGEPITGYTSSELSWFAQLLVSGGKIFKSQLALITKLYNNLDDADKSDELKDNIRSAFNTYTGKLRASNTDELLPLYAELERYLPEELHDKQDAAFSEIAAYWARYHSEANAEVPAGKELEDMISSSSAPETRQFYEQLLAEYNKAGFRPSGASADKIREAGGVESVEIYEDPSGIEVAFKGVRKKLVFLPVETKNGVIFVQQNPLSLVQYIALSNLSGFDTEYYLTSQDSLWPRSFEVGMGLGFSPLTQWQFQNSSAFSSLDAFSKTTIPAHLNEPVEILKLANNFGFRLFTPSECVDFVRAANSPENRRLEFSDSDREALEQAKTFQSSVYADLLIAAANRSGGVDFQREPPATGQFSDVIGGSADLAYDGSDFFALGGSWLYLPGRPEKPIRISRPESRYIDLGIRFVIDSPMGNYSELVRDAAVKLLGD